MLTDEEYYADAKFYAGVIDPAKKPIEYRDLAPTPFKSQISLVEYFERIKRLRADRWQRDFCDRLQASAEGRHDQATWAMVHAEAQLGKSSILAQCYPAWLLGHDPYHQIALATYNVTKSQDHSAAVIAIMNLPIHRQIFPNTAGWVSENSSKTKWSTPAKTLLNDAQYSFNPVGLQSGLVGSGFGTLIIDDPYAVAKEAFSELVRKSLVSFWNDTTIPRINDFTNVFGMFHRYHVDDLAGYLLRTGSFDYWRYATICDGDFIDHDTGRRYPDPLGRAIGEYISERRGPKYKAYVEARKSPRTWNSQFQGKPTSDEGDYFKISRIETLLTIEAIDAERSKCTNYIRSWDNAATKGDGDYSAGAKMGMQPDGTTIVFDMKLEQVDTAGRMALQKQTAEEDGPEVTVGVPKELASAGKDVVFFTEEYLKGYQVEARSVVTSGDSPGSTVKARRAHNFSIAVNSGMVKFAKGEWNDVVLRCMRNFLLSDFDDPIDAMADGYNSLFEKVRRGLVASNYRPERSLVLFESFNNHFGHYSQNGDSGKIPEKFLVYAGVKITPDASKPNSAVIVAKAPHVANMPDTLFVVGEYKAWTSDFYECFDWLGKTLDERCANSRQACIWLHSDSESYLETIRQKIKRQVRVFDGDNFAGLTEMNWYFKPTDQANPFNELQDATRLYGLIYDKEQLVEAKDADGLYGFRQEAMTWGYTDKQEPSAIGAVLDCLRMVTHSFHTIARPMSVQEQVQQELQRVQPEKFIEEVKASPDDQYKAHILSQRDIIADEVKRKIKAQAKPAPSWRKIG